jgi:pentafunctional AROM polypeptide
MGDAGKLSRALNSFLTPVTHALLPAAAAPGQLTGGELRAARRALGLGAPARAFYLFGRPVAQSLSPALHNAAFAAMGLPHGYGLVDTADAGAVAAWVGSGGAAPPGAALTPVAPRGGGGGGGGGGAPPPLPAAIGGANITMPLKQDILPFCAALSPEAAAIGAVNVLVALPGAGLFGDNTDWLGVFWPLAARLPAGGGAALVVGAGGTARAACYAAARLGLAVRVHNPRTAGKGGALARAFGGEDVPSLEGPCALLPEPPAALINTLPPAAGWAAPAWLLAPRGGALGHPVVLDVAYRPRVTPLLAQAAAAGCATVEGVEMLVAQGLAALALWTGRAGGEGAAGVRQLCGAGIPAAEATRAVYEALEADASA